MDFKELCENYRALCYIQEQEKKELEARHKRELKLLAKSHYTQIQGLALGNYFEIGDTLELGLVEYLPITHYRVKYNIINKGENYLVGFVEDENSVEILKWEDFIDAEWISHNGRTFKLDED